MPKLLPLIGVLLVALFVSACTKEGTEAPTRKFISFKLDGQPRITELSSAIMFMPNLSDADPLNDYSSLVATSLNPNFGDVLVMELQSQEPAMKAGTYSTAKTGNSFSFLLASVGLDMYADDQTGDMLFNVRVIRDTIMEGSFSGTVIDALGTPRQVTNGAFRIAFKPY